MLTSAIIHASQGHLRPSRQPPFRSPHHTSSAIALVGGGNHPKPGEISLAHAGVLFLDEFAEFAPAALQSLREPLENGEISLARANYKCRLPARFQLVAAMNPCPCGHWGTDRCHCSLAILRRYLGRISGPLLDRLDLHLEVTQPDRRLLLKGAKGESSTAIRARVIKARNLALDRQGCPNADIQAAGFDRFLRIDPAGKVLMDEAAERLQLSARALHRIMRVARTIADLEQRETVQRPHLAEALTLRKPGLLQDC
jgi:magnesium chelatase family protein